MHTRPHACMQVGVRDLDNAGQSMRRAAELGLLMRQLELLYDPYPKTPFAVYLQGLWNSSDIPYTVGFALHSLLPCIRYGYALQ